MAHNMPVSLESNMHCGNFYMKKQVLVVFLMLLSLTGYTQNDKNKLCDKWLVYDKPINGYDVKIHWQCENTNGYDGNAWFYFTKHNKTKILTQTLHLEDWFDDYYTYRGLDTLVLNQYYDESLQPYLDWRTIVGFADYNFDGKIDLVICGSPRPQSEFASDYWLDCEDYTFYEDTPEGFTQIHNVPFDILSSVPCRTFCKFDVKNRTILLLSSGGACCYESKTFYFKDGQPYKCMEIKHEELVDRLVHDTTFVSY